jgi:hypothetical protein
MLNIQIEHIVYIFIFITAIYSQCDTFDSAQLFCLSCPANTHLYRGNCLINLPYCTQYNNGFDC